MARRARIVLAAAAGLENKVICADVDADANTDRRCRCGAPMVNLAHSASFHACWKTAPSNPGIKHLAEG
jgi:hypothetical protein